MEGAAVDPRLVPPVLEASVEFVFFSAKLKKENDDYTSVKPQTAISSYLPPEGASMATLSSGGHRCVT